MTVNELIEQLEEFPGNAEIIIDASGKCSLNDVYSKDYNIVILEALNDY